MPSNELLHNLHKRSMQMVLYDVGAVTRNCFTTSGMFLLNLCTIYPIYCYKSTTSKSREFGIFYFKLKYYQVLIIFLIFSLFIN